MRSDIDYPSWRVGTGCWVTGFAGTTVIRRTIKSVIPPTAMIATMNSIAMTRPPYGGRELTHWPLLASIIHSNTHAMRALPPRAIIQFTPECRIP